MQRQIQKDAHQGQSLNQLNGMAIVESIDFSPDVKNVLGKFDKLESLYKSGKMDFNLIKCISALADCASQGQIDFFNTKRKYADETYKNKNTLKFNIQLSANHCTNSNSMHICFPIKIKSNTNNAIDIAAGMLPVNMFFAH